MSVYSDASSTSRFPLLALLNPRKQTIPLILFASVGVIIGGIGMMWFGLPLWGATLMTLGLVLIPASFKWRDDGIRFGIPFMVLSILLATQGFHTIEHITQWVQYHVLHWPLKASSGLISPLNAEIVHFTWNWAILVVVAFLLRAGLRNAWMWLLLAWAFAHTMEHTYLFVNYLQSGMQGQPGFFGADGWLAQRQTTNATIAFFCQLAPPLVQAPRLDVHFWWNIGEVALLILAAHAAVKQGLHLKPKG